jgi:hypothetical protein
MQARTRGSEVSDRAPLPRPSLQGLGPGEGHHIRLDFGHDLLAIHDGAGASGEPQVLVINGDIDQSVGRLLDVDLGFERSVLPVDSVELNELDFIDIGELLDPPGVVLVVMNSLLFS